VYLFSLLNCLLLALYIFPAKIKAVEQKGGNETFIEPTFREYMVAVTGLDDTHPNSLETPEAPEFLKVTDISIDTDARTVAVTVKNIATSSEVAFKDVTPGLTAPDGVTLVEGPKPPSANIEAGTSKTFIWIYTITSEPTEDTRFIARASGMDPHSGKFVFTDILSKPYPETEKKTVTTLSGHTNTITSVAFNSYGTLLASASLDGTIKLWNPTAGKKIREIEVHAPVLSIAFSPDGQFLASGASDGTVKLWNPETGNEVRSFRDLSLSEAKGHNGQVLSVAFSPDGKLLASSSWNGVIKIWDYQTGEELRTLEEHGSDVLSIAFSPDGQWFAAGFADSKICLFSPETRFLRENGFLTRHTGQVFSVAFSPDSQQLASGSADGTVKLWDVNTKTVTHTIRGGESNVYAVAFSPDGKLLASGTSDGTIKLWNPNTEEAMYTFEGYTGGVFSVTFQPKKQLSAKKSEEKKQLLASGSQDKIIKLWRDIEFLSVYIVDEYSFPKTFTTRRARIKFAVNYLSSFAREDITYSWQFNDEEWTESKINGVSLNRPDGQYTFRVKATSEKWNIDPTPAEVRFTIDASPETIIEEKEPLLIKTRNATIHFSGSDAEDDTSKLLYSWRFDKLEQFDNQKQWPEFSQETTVTLENLGEGKYLFQVKAKDTEGNIDPTPAETVFDASQFPDTQIINPPTEPIRTIDITIQFTGSDWQTSTAKLKYSWRADGGRWSKPNEATEANVEASEGWHLFEVKAIDEDGNEDPTSAQVSFQIVLGELLPETKITNAPRETIKTVDYTFELQGSDIPKYKWRLDSENKWHEVTNTSVTVSNLSDGWHVFEAKAVNQEGGEDPTPTRVSFDVMVEKPDTEIINKPTDTVEGSDYTFELQGSDIPRYRWRYDDKEWQETTNRFVTLENLSDGIHIFEAIAINQDGGKDPEPDRASFQVAIPKPETQIINPPIGIVYTADYSFQLRGSDISKYKWRLDGKEWQETTDAFVTPQNLSDGWHVFEAQALSQNNVEGPTPIQIRFQVKVDKNLPDTEIINAPKPQEIVKSEDYTFQLQGSDVSRYQWRLDGDKAWHEVKDTSVTLNELSDGTHVLEARAINKDGGIDPTSAIASFQISAQLPDTKIKIEFDSPIKTSDVTISFTGNDLQTPTDKLRYSWRIDGGDWSVPSNETGITLKELDNGRHLFEIKAIDTDGNEDETPAEISFQIAVPFYKSRSFILLSTCFSGLVLTSILSYFLVRYIQAYLKRERKFNPYIVGEPVLDEKMFFGRDRCLEQVADALSGGSIAIHGVRRIGKTSLLHHLEKKLERPYFPVYIDLEGIPENEFFKHLMRTIANSCKEYLEDLSQLRIHQDENRYPPPYFGMDLRQVVRNLKTQYDENTILILLLDEIDETEKYDQNVHQTLRNFFMTHAGELKMVSAGVNISGKPWSEITSPWYNFFRPLEMLPFEKIDAIKLIKDPVEHIYNYSNDAIEYILEYSDCQPYYIQIFCRYAIEKIAEERRKKVTLADVEYVAENVILEEYSSPFQERWSRFSEELQKEIRIAMELEEASGEIGNEVNANVLENQNIMNPFKEWIRRNCL